MERSCVRAIQLGLPAIAFTEHYDFTRWVVPPDARTGIFGDAHLVGADGQFDPPPLEVDGYLESLSRCRARFSELRIMSGVELGEPHWFSDRVRNRLDRARFDCLLGSLHSIEIDGRPWILKDLSGKTAPATLEPRDMVRAYLAEALRMVESCGDFAVLAHIDYPARGWPAHLGAFPAVEFEEEFRAVLRALANSGRALEINTRLPLDPEIVGWWYDVGGEAVTFGSDAHRPEAIASRFPNATAIAEAKGFRPGREPFEPWRR
jgi:histidinol-phosphatase (PHP family)